MSYPWYASIDTDDLMQGDFIKKCPIIIPSIDFNSVDFNSYQKFEAEILRINVVVISQSCDLLNKKLKFVLVCPVYTLSRFVQDNSEFKSNKMKEKLRRGEIISYHLLNKCDIKDLAENYGFSDDFLVVDFRSTFSVSFDWLSNYVIVNKVGKRLRLLPPYREHLAQSFARFIMKIGLPYDIPEFD